MFRAGVLESKRGYEPREFKFLIGKKHIDPDNGFIYIVERIGVHKGKNITCERKLVNIQTGQSLGTTDVIHALDAVFYYLISNPDAVCPLLDRDLKSTEDLMQYFNEITEVKGTERGRNKRKKRKAYSIYADDTKDPLRKELVPAREGNPNDDHTAARRSKRLRLQSLQVFMLHTRKDKIEEFRAEDVHIPQSAEGAMRSTHAKFWKDAMDSENKGLKEKDCYDICDLPEGETVIPFKWVYAVKVDSNGRIIRFKARLTARGDLVDVEELDFQEIFSPVVSWTGVRTYLALTVLLNLIPLQLDVDLAYLYAPLDKPVYMKPPDGCGCPKGKVWRLKKSLYGLPQSGNNWHRLISSVFQDNNFELIQLSTDTCLYVKSYPDGSIVLLCLYVDDIYLATSTLELQKEFVDKLQRLFKIKVLGVPNQLLGLTLTWRENFRSVHVHAGKTIRKLLRDLELYSAEGVTIPFDPARKLSKIQCPTAEEIDADKKAWRVHTKKYQQICGSAIFCNNVCRPDIAYAVGVLTRYMHNPGPAHMEAAMDLARYLAGTVELGIVFRSTGNKRPLLYCDSDRGGDESRKSTAGHVLFLANAPLAWESKLVDKYSLSTCETEIRAVDSSKTAIQTALYIHYLLEEVLSHLPQTDIESDEIDTMMSTNFDYLLEVNLLEKHEPLTNDEKVKLTIMEDNKASIDWAKKPGSSSRMKHLETDLLWIKRAVRDRLIKLQYIPTKEQLADAFTKALAPALFFALISNFMFYFKV